MLESGSASIENDVIDILKNVSRRPIEPTAESDLVADLGFDSLQVLELVAELEDRFDISIPPNDVPTALQPKIKHWCEGVIMGIDNSSCGCELTNKEWHIILQKLAKLTIWRNTTSHKE